MRKAAAVLAVLIALIFHAQTAMSQSVRAAGQTSVAVSVSGVLPGFDAAEAPKFLAAQLGQIRSSRWTFEPVTNVDHPAPDRIDWQITSAPYAGGGVRQFIPIPSLQRLFGAKRLLTAEAQLYLNGEVRSKASEQAAVIGGANDKDLAALVAKVGNDLFASADTTAHDIPSASNPSPPR